MKNFPAFDGYVPTKEGMAKAMERQIKALELKIASCDEWISYNTFTVEMAGPVVEFERKETGGVSYMEELISILEQEIVALGEVRALSIRLLRIYRGTD
jgi:hypothetical protein